MIEKQFDASIKSTQTDGATEFKHMVKNIENKGVLHRYSYPYTSPQNGVVESRYRKIVEKEGLASLFHSKVSPHF